MNSQFYDEHAGSELISAPGENETQLTVVIFPLTVEKLFGSFIIESI